MIKRSRACQPVEYERLVAELEQQLAVIERLTEELKKNSSNSNLPPSFVGVFATSV